MTLSARLVLGLSSSRIGRRTEMTRTTAYDARLISAAIGPGSALTGAIVEASKGGGNACRGRPGMDLVIKDPADVGPGLPVATRDETSGAVIIFACRNSHRRPGPWGSGSVCAACTTLPGRSQATVSGRHPASAVWRPERRGRSQA